MQTNDTIFDRYHPAVALVYCGVLLAFSMAAMHPVYLLTTFVGLAVYKTVLCGAKAALSGILWQAPLILILAIANPLFASAGSTELFRIGLHAVYLEALCYGLCQGLMLVNVLLAFSIAAHVVSSDKVLCVLGNATPPHARAHDLHDHALGPAIRTPRQGHRRYAESVHRRGIGAKRMHRFST